MPHFHIKKKKGISYLYIRECQRVDGIPKIIWQIYLGNAEKVLASFKGEKNKNITKKIKVFEYGALWLADLLNKKIDIAKIIDNVIPGKNNEKDGSIGEYFLFSIWNRMICPKSKNQISNWYQKTAIKLIKPVKITKLNSQRYWEKFDRVTEEDLKNITLKFFQEVRNLYNPGEEYLIFDTTNYYTYMASNTKSELAKRGHNKDSKHHLKQIGCALLTSGKNRMPMHYCIYPGNLHDSKIFEKTMDEMFGKILEFNKNSENITIVIDKGMNSKNNFKIIDGKNNLHFVTTYSTYFAEDLAQIDIKDFQPLNKENEDKDQILAFRTKGIFWEKERTVVVTFNPRSARKKRYNFENKMEKIRHKLLEIQEKVSNRESFWQKKEAILDHYHKYCSNLHFRSDLFNISLKITNGLLKMSFSENTQSINNEINSFGKNIIITDNIDWKTENIIKASIDRWQVEKNFRDSKNLKNVSTMPIRHWTDSKIRCHLFTCIIAMSYLRMLEVTLEKNGLLISSENVMESLSKLHLVIESSNSKKDPIITVENPNKKQSLILKTLGFRVLKGRVTPV